MGNGTIMEVIACGMATDNQLIIHFLFYIKCVRTNNGTMRWQPPFTMEETEAMETKGRLFHPVK